MDTHAGSSGPEILGMDKPNTSSAPAAILWITFVMALGLTTFLFMASRSAINAVEAKTQARDEILSELQSPSYQSVEEKSKSFKEAFDILNTLSASRAPKKEILDGLFQNFTKDVYIKNLAVSESGAMTIDGSTSSYRSVADFMVALKQNKRVSNVQLMVVSLDATPGVDAKLRVIFSISGKVDLSKEKPAVIDTTADSSADSVVDGNSADSSYGDDLADPTADTTADSAADSTYDAYDDNTLSPSDAADSATEGGL